MSQFKLNPFLNGNNFIVSNYVIPQIKFINISFAYRLGITLLAYGISGSTTFAADDSQPAVQLPTLVIEAKQDLKVDPLHLKQVNTTSSRLGLTSQETPATVQTITQKELQEKGVRTVKEAFGNVTGATVGNVPGNPAVLTMRGFSGNTNTVLQDGVRIGASTFVTRDLDVWKYEKIEVLKGPSSVLFGEGALGGAVNLITKKPNLEQATVEGMLNYGSFNTLRTAIGGNLPLNDELAVRSDISFLRSDSLFDIDNQKTVKFGAAGSLLYKPNDHLSMLFSANFDHDKETSSYNGSPLVSASTAKNPSNILDNPDGLVIDKATRHKNYNPYGGELSADTTTLSWATDYQLSPSWTFNNIATYYHADRKFYLSPEQNFDSQTGLFKRTVQRWSHDHDVWSDRFSFGHDQLIAGKYRNRLSVGSEYSYTDFSSPRPSGNLNAVDPYHPNVGDMPASNWTAWTSYNKFSTQIKNWSVFAEDAFNITPDWLIVGGARYERLDVERTIDNILTDSQQQFNPTFNPFSWRIGSVYNLTPDTQLYGQYSTAVTPVSSLLVISTANGSFDLSKGKSAELGFKSSVLDGKLDMVGSVYWIELNDILTRDPNNINVTVQGGQQVSKGVEFTASAAITPQLKANLGLAWVDAEYKKLIEAGGANRSGNQPVNVPEKVANASLSYQFKTLPMTVSGFAKHVSGFYTDTANTYFVKGYTTYDASLAYDLKNMTFTLWGRNLTDQFFGEYSGYSSKQIYIGAPRSVELGVTFKF
ncbi:TonB-dependent siderophore receptor [uncultured Acinetobacter sp.]|jgi:iron complex outermembrane receptor protein|uniref:TonB-dependent receptor n=1 Tax=uncultured Acinetobacter sp. TaxID=165433 RepID=UPI0025847A71|nr:TonB-dependent siderophore receptor [uncultured Acinetobacter sp.]